MAIRFRRKAWPDQRLVAAFLKRLAKFEGRQRLRQRGERRKVAAKDSIHENEDRIPRLFVGKAITRISLRQGRTVGGNHGTEWRLRYRGNVRVLPVFLLDRGKTSLLKLR